MHADFRSRRGAARALPALLAAVGFLTPQMVPALLSPAFAATSLNALARLTGRFVLAGRITDARRVYGEHPGQSFLRVWTFTPACRTGSCHTIKLDRRRSDGSDRLLLQRTAPGLYRGSGMFYAPLRCGRRTYAQGSSVPFTITVRVTAAVLYGPTVYATRLSASYVNRTRTNLTPCVAFLGHDAASLHGHLSPATATPAPS